jgi:GntR family transcriptional regulator / MocR family aminotransferase
MYLELDGTGSAYGQLARALKRAILQGRLKAGDKLPATRQLADETGLARNTIVTAYELLCAERLAVARQGSGTYVADGVVAAAAHTPQRELPPQSQFAARLRKLPRPSLGRIEPPLRYDLHYGEPLLDLALTTAWRGQLGRVAARVPLGYPPSQGLAALREQIAEYLARRRGLACSPADIVITSGTQQAIALLANLLLDPGDVAALEEPYYEMVSHALRLHGARVIALPTDREGLVLERWPALPRVVYTTPSHQFPSGVVMSLARRLALLHDAAERRYWVIEDDYDGEFRFDQRPLPALRSLDLRERVVYIGSFSKVMFPALRLAYVVCPPGLRDDLVLAKRYHDLGSSLIEQSALAEFMAGGAFDRHLRKSAAELRRRRTELLEGLARHCARDIEVADSRAGMHVVGWLKGFDAERRDRLLALAREEGLGLHAIDPYYVRPPPRPGLVLGFAGLSPTQIRAATRLLGACLERLRDDYEAARAPAMTPPPRQMSPS